MQLIAHRGASDDAPENTLLALSLAREQRADAAEIDVQLTSDGVPVVFHDWETMRLTGEAGTIKGRTLAEIRRLRVRGEPIPTLAEVLEARARPDALVLELKSNRLTDLRVAAQTWRVVRQYPDARDRGRIVCSSFNPMCLLALRRATSELPRAMLAHEGLPLPLRRLWARWPLGASELHLDRALATSRRIACARLEGRAVVVWTVNDAREARELKRMGVAGVITDRPGALRAEQAGRISSV